MKIGKLEDFPEGTVRVVKIDGERVAICNVEGSLYAVEDRCTHDDAPLGEQELDGCEIECPRHGARFDVRDGSVTQMPAVYPIETFELKIENGEVFVTID